MTFIHFSIDIDIDICIDLLMYFNFIEDNELTR